MLSDWLALAGVLTAAGVNIGGYLIAWGALKGQVIALSSRVSALESQMRALDELKLDVARLQTRLDTLIDQVRDLNASIRWMREPEARPRRGAAVSGA